MATLGKQRGNYFLQFYHKDRTPQRKRVALNTKKKRDADALRAKLERDYLLGDYDPWTDDPFTYDRHIPKEHLTISDALTRFIEQKRSDGRQENTLDAYRWFIDGLIKRVGKSLPIEQLDAASISSYVHDRSVKKTTGHARFRHVRAFVRWCIKKEYIQHDPLKDVTAPDKPQKMPKSMTKDELQAICNGLRKYYRKKLAERSCREGELLWLIPAWQFQFYTGMRSSEIARLRWGHIDADKGLIYIYKQKSKKEQTIPLNNKATKILRQLKRGGSDEYVFKSPSFKGKSRSARQFASHSGRVFKTAREEAKIKRKLTPHCLRHSFCTMIAEAGKSAIVVKEAARHADIQTSMIYVHLSNEHLKSELDDVFG